MELKWTILCFLGAVLILGNCKDWMAGGTFTQEEFTTLRSKVDGFNKALNYQGFAAGAKTMSNELNDLWHPAWNVVINYNYNGNYDTILYGYAFNNRWFWFNGFQQTGGEFISFIIWKDYNCVTWFDYSPDSQYATYSLALSIAINNKIQEDLSTAIRDLTDIWKVAQDIQEKVITADASLLQDKLAYTIIASQ